MSLTFRLVKYLLLCYIRDFILMWQNGRLWLIVFLSVGLTGHELGLYSLSLETFLLRPELVRLYRLVRLSVKRISLDYLFEKLYFVVSQIARGAHYLSLGRKGYPVCQRAWLHFRYRYYYRRCRSIIRVINTALFVLFYLRSHGISLLLRRVCSGYRLEFGTGTFLSVLGWPVKFTVGVNTCKRIKLSRDLIGQLGFWIRRSHYSLFFLLYIWHYNRILQVFQFKRHRIRHVGSLTEWSHCKGFMIDQDSEFITVQVWPKMVSAIDNY